MVFDFQMFLLCSLFILVGENVFLRIGCYCNKGIFFRIRILRFIFGLIIISY